MSRPVQTHCKDGHPFTQFNRIKNTSSGGTTCRLCSYKKNNERRKRKRRSARMFQQWAIASQLLNYLESILC